MVPACRKSKEVPQPRMSKQGLEPTEKEETHLHPQGRMTEHNQRDILLDGLFKRLARVGLSRASMGELYWYQYRRHLVEEITRLLCEPSIHK